MVGGGRTIVQLDHACYSGTGADAEIELAGCFDLRAADLVL